MQGLGINSRHYLNALLEKMKEPLGVRTKKYREFKDTIFNVIEFCTLIGVEVTIDKESDMFRPKYQYVIKLSKRNLQQEIAFAFAVSDEDLGSPASFVGVFLNEQYRDYIGGYEPTPMDELEALITAKDNINIAYDIQIDDLDAMIDEALRIRDFEWCKELLARKEKLSAVF